MFVYVIVCIETLKIYVGQHKGSDLGKYLSRKFWDANHHTSGRRSHLYNAMRKYRRETWGIHSLVSGIETRQELDELERHFIKILKTQHPDVGYNICDGGEGFSGHHTPEAKQKMLKKLQAYWQKPESHQLRREITQRMWADPNKKQQICAAIKAAPNPTRFAKGHTPSLNAGAKGPTSTSFKMGLVPWNIGTKGVVKPNSGSFQQGYHLGTGRIFSEAHRQHLSLSHLGHSNTDKGKTRSEETKQKLRDAWVQRRARASTL